ncbi:MAG: uracil-DNA glycosylase [Desulfobacterales bacterium]|nr:uracil-DNA glycosylase [Desulfobacterales bacterium]
MESKKAVRTKRIDCHKCKHYYVTWDEHFPHGCHAMRFKSKEFPSAVVRQSSGMSCFMFEQKARAQSSKKKATV